MLGCGAGAGCQAGGGENLFQLAGADDRVDFGNVLLNLVAEALDQASGDDEFLGLAAGFVGGHLEDGVDRFLLRALDERAGVDDDDVGVFGAAGEFGSGARQQAHHDFAVDEVFGAAEADEAHFLRAGGLRILRQIAAFPRLGLSSVLRSGLRSREPLTVRSFTGMQSFYFSIPRGGIRHRSLLIVRKQRHQKR